MTEQKYQAILRGITIANPNGGRYNVSQLYSLNLSTLERIFEVYRAEIASFEEKASSDWASLFSKTNTLSKEQEKILLEYEILVDAIQLKNADAEADKKAKEQQVERRTQKQLLLEALAVKQQADLQNLSIDELRKKIEALG